MFWTLIYPTSGACDCVAELPHRSFCSVKTEEHHKFTLKLNPPSLQNKTTDVVIQQQSRKLLMMDILMSETFWVR